MKKIVAAIVVLLFILVALTIAPKIYNSLSVTTDENGWTHEKVSSESSDTEDSSGDKDSLNYVVISASKSDYNIWDNEIDSHTYSNNVFAATSNYEGKQYVTFDFGDGTGLYYGCPSSEDSTYSTGTYGEIDEEGLVVEPYYYIYASGSEIWAELVPAGVSQVSAAITEAIPDTYDSDWTSAAVVDGIAYICLYSPDGFVIRAGDVKEVTDETEENLIREMREVATILEDEGLLDGITKICFAFEDYYGAEYNVSSGEITRDDGVIDDVYAAPEY